FGDKICPDPQGGLPTPVRSIPPECSRRGGYNSARIGPSPGRGRPTMPAPEVPPGESAEPPSSSPEPPSSPPTAAAPQPYQAAWVWVLCVVGLDYLSTLAYQPTIAFAAAGRLAPLVTVLVAAVPLRFALPIYCYIAGPPHHGRGPAAPLARLRP